jgi:hypothetical protein
MFFHTHSSGLSSGEYDGKKNSWRRPSRDRHGIFLRPATKEHIRPETLDHPHRIRLAIITSIERTYHHRRRRQTRLGGLAPIEFETINHLATVT